MSNLFSRIGEYSSAFGETLSNLCPGHILYQLPAHRQLGLDLSRQPIHLLLGHVHQPIASALGHVTAHHTQVELPILGLLQPCRAIVDDPAPSTAVFILVLVPARYGHSPEVFHRIHPPAPALGGGT